jgi:hypothetical protein
MGGGKVTRKQSTKMSNKSLVKKPYFFALSGHRVETYRDVTDRCKHCGRLRYHVPIMYHVLSKFKASRHQVVIQSDACV